MPDVSLLNHAVVSTWGQRVIVRHSNIAHRLDAVLIDGYRDTPAGNADIEQEDPYFSFRAGDFYRTGAVQGDTIESDGVTWSIVGDPRDDGGEWVNVPVRVYG